MPPQAETSTPRPHLLELEGLRTRLRSSGRELTVVDGVSLSIRRGTTLSLVGESGCGKSMTALSMLRLLDPSLPTAVEGRAWFDGVDLLTLPEREMRRIRGGRIGMIFQEPATSLHPAMTIGQQIGESIRLHRRVSKRTARNETVALLNETRIPDPSRRASQYPHELSGGMKQRAMIAMALAGKPDLLIADEPTTALDVTVQAQILRVLRRLQLEHKLTILLITHDLGVVAELADDVAVMYAGKVVEHTNTRELFRNPRHPYTRGLLASVPRIDGGGRPAPIDGVVPSPDAWPLGCRFRSRCPQAFDNCVNEPQLFAAEDAHSKHTVACWLDHPSN